MHCIKCGSLIEEPAKVCPVCAALLVAPGSSMDLAEYTVSDLYDAAGLEWSMTPIAVLRNTAEVSVARGLLEGSGIPVEIRAPNGIRQNTGSLVASIELMVPEPLADYAKEVLVYSSNADESKEITRLADTELATVAKGFGVLTFLAGLLAISVNLLRTRRPVHS